MNSFIGRGRDAKGDKQESNQFAYASPETRAAALYEQFTGEQRRVQRVSVALKVSRSAPVPQPSEGHARARSAPGRARVQRTKKKRNAGLGPDSPSGSAPSKVLFPSLRLGFVVPPPSLYSPVLSVKWLTDRHSEISEQHLIAAFIAEGHFARYIRRMQRIYFERQTTLLRSLGQWMPFVRPVSAVAGLHLAGLLPPGFPVDDLISRAAATGVGLYSIAPFFQNSAKAGLMFGFGSCTVGDIAEGIRRVGNVCKAMGLAQASVTGFEDATKLIA